MIDYASLALISQAVAWILAALAFRVQKAAYTDFVWDHAKKGGGRYSRSNAADVAEIHKLVANQQKSILLEAVVLALALVLLSVMIRRTRGATPARWSVVIIAVLTQTPLAVLAVTSSIPAFIKITQLLVGLLSIVSLVLLFLPASRQYFREVRGAVTQSLPPRTARAGRSGGLFGTRGGATAAPRASAANVVDVEPVERVDMVKRESGKRRTESNAVAKGAALARSRAKAAAKSRRTED
jgi:hypothetical protein